MKRRIELARTPTGQTTVNKLTTPQFALEHLAVAVGTKVSKPHYPAHCTPAAPSPGSDAFNFLPEHEVAEIRYELENRQLHVDGGTLEIFSRFSDKPLWTLDLKALGASWWAHGKHVIKWDGRVVAQPTATQDATVKNDGTYEHDLNAFAPDTTTRPDTFPDGYITLEHTPYKVKLTFTSKKPLEKRPAVAWTYVQILLHGMEVELGPEQAVPAAIVGDNRHVADKAVRAQIGSIPAPGATRRVYLVSNLFKTHSNQMGTDESFTRHETAWGEGPKIPLVAKISLQDSKGQQVKVFETNKGAVALGKARFSWDWTDPSEDIATANAVLLARTYISKAIDFYKDGTDATRSNRDHTYPKGDNCHVDRGGKRGPDARPVFPPQAGYDPKNTLDAGTFPFEVKAWTKRTWASYSTAWSKGALKGQTGVLFRPSRMAGDDYELCVYLAYDKTASDEWMLDVTDEPLRVANVLEKATGKLQIWRKLHIVRYIRKQGTIGTFLPANLGAVQAFYRPAYVEVESLLGPSNDYVLSDHRLANNSAPDYDTICEGIINGSGNALFTDHLAVEANADHAGVAAAFRVRSYSSFVRAVHTHLHAPSGVNDFADAPAVVAHTLGNLNLSVHGVPSGPRKNRLRQTRQFLRNSQVADRVSYRRTLDRTMFPWAKGALTSALQVVSGGKTGGGTAAREGITVVHFENVHSAGSGGKLGSAINPADATGEKCVFLLTRSATDTFAHEIGHHLFLAHAPNAGGNKPDTHDELHVKCMMSYNRPRQAFCGQCQLRLRGWKGSVLSKSGASNKKP